MQYPRAGSGLTVDVQRGEVVGDADMRDGDALRHAGAAAGELEEAELADTAAHDSDAARETWQRAWRVIARVARTTPDVAATAAQSLAQHRPAGAPLPAELLELAPILRRAGLMP